MVVTRGLCVAVAATALLSTAPSVSAQIILGGNGLCADPASLGPNVPAGNYSPVDKPNSNDIVMEAAQAAATKYFEDDENGCYQEVIEICGADATSFADSVDVTAACTQVVAGTNVKVAFTATIPCSDENKQKLSDQDKLTQTFEADVFVPLPSSDESVDVTSVEEKSGKCVKVESSPPMVGGNGLCADPASLGPNAPVGGFSPVDEPSSNDVVTEAAQAAATKYFEDDENGCYQEVIEICGADATSFADSVDVTAACTQVVAGTNVKVAFTATIPCSDENKQKLSDQDKLTQTFEADVFVPLPSSDESVDVTSVEEKSGKCVKVESSPPMVGDMLEGMGVGSGLDEASAPSPSSASIIGGACMAIVSGICSFILL